MSSIVRSHFDQLVAGIADGRGLSEDAIRDLFDRGPFLGREALDAGLVDVLAYRDEVFAAVREEIGSDAGYVDLASYAEGATGGAGTTVALINGLGSVVVGESEYDPFTGDRRMGSETIAEAFRDATDDDGVEAILFRVDSPGGSYVASDTIWRETIRARDAGKPVIVSMGDVAGSGGYFVAMAADAIVAHPGTLTGSIGVYGGKLVAAELWDKIGIGWDGVVSSENARMWSGNHDFSDRGWGRMQASLDRIYADFTAKVAAGRGLEPETVERIARGRIWTGAEALENGLVDELGGYPAALSRVREALDLAEGARLRLREFPRPKSTFELLSDLSWTGSGAAEARLALQAIERLRPVLRAASRAGLFGPGPQALSMPEVSPLR